MYGGRCPHPNIVKELSQNKKCHSEAKPKNLKVLTFQVDYT